MKGSCDRVSEDKAADEFDVFELPARSITLLVTLGTDAQTTSVNDNVNETASARRQDPNRAAQQRGPKAFAYPIHLSKFNTCYLALLYMQTER
jgi:hypothetical protein